MVVLRATQKLRKALPETASDSDLSDTALGDWYINRIIIDRKPLLLLVSSKSLLAMLCPARNVKTLPNRISEMVARRLERLGIDEKLIRKEVEAMNVVVVGRTRDRSVTGHMVNFAYAVPYYIPIGGVNELTVRHAEDELGDTPCRCGQTNVATIWPIRDTERLLALRWTNFKTVH